MQKQWPNKSSDCKHDDSCLQSIVIKFLKNFGQAIAVKLLLKLLGSKGNLLKVLRAIPDAARFGLAIGLCSALFKITKCLFKHSNLNLNPDLETFIAAAVSSLGLLLATDDELQLMTILIYPKVIEVGLRLMQERGWIRNFKYSETLGFIICSMIIVYCYVFEPMNMPKSYVKGINNFAMLTQGEATIFAAATEQVTRNIQRYYFGKQV